MRTENALMNSLETEFEQVWARRLNFLTFPYDLVSVAHQSVLGSTFAKQCCVVGSVIPGINPTYSMLSNRLYDEMIAIHRMTNCFQRHSSQFPLFFLIRALILSTCFEPVITFLLKQITIGCKMNWHLLLMHGELMPAILLNS